MQNSYNSRKIGAKKCRRLNKPCLLYTSNPEITLPAGAGDVPTANFKMIAALAVMKKAIEKADMVKFTKEHGMTGFVHTQGHIPSGVPFMGHAADAINAGKMTRAMIIGKGSLFLGRLTNLADGASFLIEKPQPKQAEATVSKEEIRELILEDVYKRQGLPPAAGGRRRRTGRRGALGRRGF